MCLKGESFMAAALLLTMPDFVQMSTYAEISFIAQLHLEPLIWHTNICTWQTSDNSKDTANTDTLYSKHNPDNVRVH